MLDSHDNTMVSVEAFRKALQEPRFAARQAEKDIASFKKRLDEDPANAFEWSDGAFKAAAKMEVSRRILHWIDWSSKTASDFRVGDLHAWIVKQAIEVGSSGGSSTSQPSNIIKMYVKEVWASAANNNAFGILALEVLAETIWNVERDEINAKRMAATWRIASKVGEYFVTLAGGWTSNSEKAGTWSFADRPALPQKNDRADRGAHYQMFDDETNTWK